MLTTEQLENAEWSEVKKKVPGSRSKKVFDVGAFRGTESSSAPPTPIQHTVHQLTDAKANAQTTPDGHEAAVLLSNFLLPWATGASAAAAKKRKRVDRDDDSDEASSDKDKDDDDDGDYSS